MGNMREIRDRIKSINDIMKITNAMYLISSSKLKKAKKDLAATQPYFNKLVYAMRSILSRAPDDINMRYFDRREEIKPEDRKVGYIVITADKGMCGSYNHNVIKLTEEKMPASTAAFLLWDKWADCISSAALMPESWMWMQSSFLPPRILPCIVPVRLQNRC